MYMLIIFVFLLITYFFNDIGRIRGGANDVTCKQEFCVDAVNRLTRAAIRSTAILLRNLIVPNQTVIQSAALDLLLACQSALYTKEGSASHEELLNLLNLQNNDEVRCACKTLINIMTQQEPSDNTTFAATSINIYADQQYPFTFDFKRDMRLIAKGEANNYDLDDPETFAEKINEQAEEDTYSVINNIISPDTFKSDTQLIYTSALFFQSLFDGLAVDGDFEVTPCETVITPYINAIQEYNYVESEELDAKAVEVPYPGTNFICLSILPNYYCDVESLLRRVEDPNTFYVLRNSMEKVLVNVTIPKLATTTIQTSTQGVRQANLVTYLFDKDTSDYENAIRNDIPVEVNVGIQKIVYVDKANGNTPSEVPVSDDMKQFLGNRPHIYYILADGIPILGSYIINPNNQDNAFSG